MTEKMIPGTVNKILRYLRLQRGLTQSDIAEVLNISQREYWRYEQNGYSVNFYKLARIAVFYNISLDYFTGLFPEPKPMFLEK